MTRPDIGTDPAFPILSEIWRDLDFGDDALDRITICNEDRLPSCFAVSDLAAAAIGAACLAISELIGLEARAPHLVVDRRLASLWFGMSIRPQGWEMPAPWDPIAGDYQTEDGWIRLHTNAPHHRAAALSVMQCDGTREAVAEAVKQWSATALETAIVAVNGCAAEMRTTLQWNEHLQGRASAMEPLLARAILPGSSAGSWHPEQSRPLEGIRVLDLTRVLAGPVATRFLAGYGADVLRVDPLDLDEPGVIPEVTPGKRCIRLDLRDLTDRSTFERLLAGADVIVHGYRKDAMERLGYGEAQRQSIRPDIIDVSLNAYGHSGPWSTRRGFDSLVQMSCGIADAGMTWKTSGKPSPLPVQALDHATGYLMAATIVRAIISRTVDGVATTGRLSLARTAKLLDDHKAIISAAAMAPSSDADIAPYIEHTSWGPARRLNPPAILDSAAMRWDSPATAPGSGKAQWRDE